MLIVDVLSHVHRCTTAPDLEGVRLSTSSSAIAISVIFDLRVESGGLPEVYFTRSLHYYSLCRLCDENTRIGPLSEPDKAQVLKHLYIRGLHLLTVT